MKHCTDKLVKVVGIELVKIILLTIPYLLASSDNVSLQQKASELLEKTDIVASAPHALEALVDPYPSREGEEKPMAFGSLIGLLQRQLQAEAASGWKLACIPRVYEPRVKPASTADGEANGNGEATQIAQHTFPDINIPSPVSAGAKPLFPEIFFSLYADQEIESVPPTSTVAASLVRDGLIDTINILDFNRNAAAKILTQMDNFWAPGVFARRETAFDKLRDFSSDVSTWKPEDISVDAIFSQIFRLPASEHRLVYYHSLITELCKISPAAVAPSLGRAIRFLFRSLESMDMELSYRFMDWFAHHLSNFEFRWKWGEWYAY
jgi:nuclear cap-binding protein subunit 1